MIIISQAKETILNFKNVQEIRIEEYGTHVKGKKIYKIFSGNFEGYATLLGTYETKERAKEVLQEIIDSYSDSIDYMYNQTLLIGELEEYRESLVYRMPKE